MKRIILITCSARDFVIYRLGLMKALKNMGFEVIGIAPFDRYAQEIIDKGYRFIDLNINRKGINPVQDLILFLKMTKIYFSEKPIASINFTIKPIIYGTIAGWLAGIKIIDVITGLGYVFTERRGLLTKIVKVMYKISLIFSYRVIFQNKDDKEFFQEEKIVKKKKTELILSSGINVDYFKPMKKSRNKSISFLFIGRMLWDKGVKEFVESAAIIKRKYVEVKFNMIGWFDNGNPSCIPEEYIKNYMNKKIIVYLGDVNDVRQIIAENDIVVLPSYREGVPHSLLEAASMEKPIITTDIVGCREVVDNKINGLLVPVREIDKLVEAMIWMIEHPKERREMGKRGRKKIIKEFDEKLVVKKYLNLIIPIV